MIDVRIENMHVPAGNLETLRDFLVSKFQGCEVDNPDKGLKVDINTKPLKPTTTSYIWISADTTYKLGQEFVDAALEEAQMRCKTHIERELLKNTIGVTKTIVISPDDAVS